MPALDRVERFMQQGTTLEEVEVRVVEMTGEPGDVYLVHPLMMHAASPNCLATPRMVLSSTVYQRGIDWSALYGAEARGGRLIQAKRAAGCAVGNFFTY